MLEVNFDLEVITAWYCFDSDGLRRASARLGASVTESADK